MKITPISRLAACFILACSAACAPAFAQESSFEDLRRGYDAVTVSSASQLRADAPSLAGRVVDLQGEVAGFVTREGARTVLLKMGNEMAVLAANGETKNAALLQAGTLVRLLARVSEAGQNSGFAILTVTGNSAAGESRKSTPENDEGDEDAALIAPVTAIIETLPEAPDSVIDPDTVAVVKGSKVTTPAKRSPAKAAPAKKTAPTKSPAQLPSDKPSASELEDVIEAQVSAYAALVRRHNKKLKPAVVEEISQALLRAGYKHNMDPRFIAAIIAVESDFDVYCRSHSGALGLGQMMPFNLKEAGVTDPWNPTQNVMGTAQLLRNLLDKYKNRSNGTLLAVAAYNAGQGAVRRAGYKVPKGAQVQRYVWKVYNRYKAFAPDMFK